MAIFFCMFTFGLTKLYCAFKIYKEFTAATEGYMTHSNNNDDNFMNANGQ